jgi:hypothetical protein
MFYEEVFRALNKARVDYVVAGGVAVVLHGYVRFTADLDLIIRLESENIDRFFDVLAALGYRIRLPVTREQFKVKKNREDWIKKKGKRVFSFYHAKSPLKMIDIFVREPMSFRKIIGRVKRIKVKDIDIPVLCLDDLIRLKNAAGRPQDLIDVMNLKGIHK